MTCSSCVCLQGLVIVCWDSASLVTRSSESLSSSSESILAVLLGRSGVSGVLELLAGAGLTAVCAAAAG